MKIHHIYHSGFMVTMEKYVFLFDWYKGELPPIDPEKKLFVFCSHAHEDHYSPAIWTLREKHPDVLYILDAGIPDAVRHPEADVLTVEPRKLYLIREDGSKQMADPEQNSVVPQPADLLIRTLESTDMGVAFYLETEGKRIYHAGDLNVWFWYDEPMEDNIASEKKCRQEMQYLADHIPARDGGALLDAAFVPLDPRLREDATRCMAAFLEILGAAYVFPMHYWGKEDTVRGYLAEMPLPAEAGSICFDREKEI